MFTKDKVHRTRASTSGCNLKADEIEQLYVQPGKIGACGNAAVEKCDVWGHFGALYMNIDGAKPCIVDNTQHWCKLCVEKFRKTGRASKMQHYKKSTGTSSLRMHLRNVHGLRMVGI